MSKHSYRACSASHERLFYENTGSKNEVKESSKKIKESLLNISRVKSCKRQKQRNDNKVYRIFQTLLLLFSVLLLSYQSVSNGRMTYGFMKNGVTTYGYASHQKREETIVATTLGYSFPHSVIYTVTGLMLAYSLISGKSYWSFPLIAFFLADLVCDVSEAILVIFLFFRRFPFLAASYYATAILLLIAGEIWAFLGLLSLYEHNMYK